MNSLQCAGPCVVPTTVRLQILGFRSPVAFPTANATVAPAACFVTHAGFTLKFVEILPSVVGGQ